MAASVSDLSPAESAVCDFVFDLYSAAIKSQKIDVVTPINEVQFKDLCERYFSQKPWPTCAQVASECEEDEVFLLFYQ